MRFLFFHLVFFCASSFVCGEEKPAYGFEKTSRIYIALMSDLDKKERIAKRHIFPAKLAARAKTDLKNNHFRKVKASIAFAGFCYAILCDENDEAICALYVPYLTTNRNAVASVHRIKKIRGKYIIGKSLGGWISFRGLDDIREYAIRL